MSSPENSRSIQHSVDFKGQKVEKRSKSIILFVFGFSLATGRWGSYLGWYHNNLFLEDLLLALAAVPIFFSKQTLLSVKLLYQFSLFIFVVAYFYMGRSYSHVTELRDLSPFLYFLFLPASVKVFSKISDVSIIKVVRFATLFHMTWYLLHGINFLPELTIPYLSGVPLFIERSDASGMIMGIGIIAWSEYSEYSLKGNWYVISLELISAAFGWSRAGLIGALIGTIILLVKIYLSKRSKDSLDRKKAFFFILISVGFIGVTNLGILNFGDNSSLVRLSVISGNSNAIQTAANTANARALARNRIYEWTMENGKWLHGWGPGAEIVANSGAVVYLSGNLDVRAPHNWSVSLFSRYGIVGTIFWILLIGYPILFVRKCRTDFKYLILGSIIIIVIVSLLGVIMESPFGSIPIMMFSSILISRRFSGSKIGDS
jgi:hypothetical protein